MDNEINVYLEKVSRGLGAIPELDKNEIIQEIKSHIYEAANRQESVRDVLERLGNPLQLAKSYTNSYLLENSPLKISDIFGNIAFYSSAALSGMLIIPTLSIVSVTFILSSIFIMAVAVLNTTGIINMPFNLGFMPVTGIWQIVMAVIISAILCLVANISWAGLRKYMRFVSSNYYKTRIGK